MPYPFKITILKRLNDKASKGARGKGQVARLAGFTLTLATCYLPQSIIVEYLFSHAYFLYFNNFRERGKRWDTVNMHG